MKQYPPRVPNPVHVCECGHADFDHEVSFFKDLHCLIHPDQPCGAGNCRRCLCPKFKLEDPNEQQSRHGVD